MTEHEQKVQDVLAWAEGSEATPDAPKARVLLLDPQGKMHPASPEETAHLLSDPTRPDHYGPKGLQVLDALKVWMTPEEYRGFLRGNVIKYAGRLGKKDAALQDARKAREYLDLLITELEDE